MHMPETTKIFTKESCMPNRIILFNVLWLGPYLGHVWAILGLCLGYFYNIFASRCLKWLKYPPKSCMQITKKQFTIALLDPHRVHVLPILGLCFGYFYNIFASRCLKWLKFSLKSHACQLEEYHSMSNYWDHIRAMLGPY